MSVQDTLIVARAQERLRQEHEAFNQLKRHGEKWLPVRLAMAWTAVPMLPLIGGVSAWILFHPADYPPLVLKLGAGALLIDLVGLLVSIWRVVIGEGPNKLEPVTVDDSDVVSNSTVITQGENEAAERE